MFPAQRKLAEPALIVWFWLQAVPEDTSAAEKQQAAYAKVSDGALDELPPSLFKPRKQSEHESGPRPRQG